jgi:hypothetical protein
MPKLEIVTVKLKFLFIACCFLLIQNLKASSEATSKTFRLSAVSDSVVLTGNSSWQLIKTTAEVKLFIREADCIDEVNGISMKKVIIKIENLTNSIIAVEWDNKLRYSNGYVNQSGASPEQHKRIVVEASSIVEGNCIQNNGLVIYAGMIGVESEKLISLQILNLSIYK